jgi:hypothetical protein
MHTAFQKVLKAWSAKKTELHIRANVKRKGEGGSNP